MFVKKWWDWRPLKAESENPPADQHGLLIFTDPLKYPREDRSESANIARGVAARIARRGSSVRSPEPPSLLALECAREPALFATATIVSSSPRIFDINRQSQKSQQSWQQNEK
jgi:hypothetical protein